MPKKNIAELLDNALERFYADGLITCRQAFTVSEQTGITPAEIAEAINARQIKIYECQMGLFGFGNTKKAIRPAATVSHVLQNEIQNALNNQRLTCRKAWQIADSMQLPRISVAQVCESLGIKISHCQLGAFR